MEAEKQLHYYVLLFFTAHTASQLQDEFAVAGFANKWKYPTSISVSLNLGLYLSYTCHFFLIVSLMLKAVEQPAQI